MLGYFMPHLFGLETAAKHGARVAARPRIFLSGNGARHVILAPGGVRSRMERIGRSVAGRSPLIINMWWGPIHGGGPPNDLKRPFFGARGQAFGHTERARGTWVPQSVGVDLSPFFSVSVFQERGKIGGGFSFWVIIIASGRFSKRLAFFFFSFFAVRNLQTRIGRYLMKALEHQLITYKYSLDDQRTSNSSTPPCLQVMPA